MSGSSQEGIPDAGSGREALPDVREWTEVPSGCPGVVEWPFRMSGCCREALPDV